MKVLKFLLVSFVLLFICNTIQAQIGRRLGNAAERAAERAVVRQTERRIERAIDSAIDNALDGSNDNGNQSGNTQSGNNNQQSGANQSSGNGNQQSGSNQSAGNQPAASTGTAAANSQDAVKAAEMAYAKSDFVSGDEIIFEDNLVGERLGEFPSMWDMLSGNVEITRVNGENSITLFKSAGITPLMKTPKNYLPESFTIELDFYIGDSNHDSNTYINGNYNFFIRDADNRDIVKVFFWGYAWDEKLHVDISLRSTGNDWRQISDVAPNIKEGWHHLAISFNRFII